MLSPGKFHLEVPKVRRENLLWRKATIERGNANKEFRKEVLDRCRNDLLFWVNGFVFQINPVKINHEEGPFITWPFQDKVMAYGCEKTWGILGCVEDQKDLAVEKSREMGASWMFLLVADWLARFHRNKQFTMISKDAPSVDNKSLKSLFGKLDYVDRWLPDWMRVERNRTKGFIGYPGNSEISAEASTEKSGVSGRATAMFIDEFAQIEKDREVMHRTSDTARCRIFNSTHVGMGTAFYDLCHPKSGLVATRKTVIHWSQHPEKVAGLYRAKGGMPDVIDKTYDFPADYGFVLDGSPVGGPYPGLRSVWYDEQGPRKGSARAVAEDLDINPSGSVEQFFDPLEIDVLKTVYACEPYWAGEVLYDRDRGVVLELTQADRGRLKLWCQLHEGKPPPGKYGMGVDVSAGTGTTPSVFSIVNGETGEKVAEYACPNTKPDHLGTLAVALGQMFYQAEMAWEMQGPGVAFGQRVIELNYPRMYYRVDEFDRKKTRSDKPGWYPSPKGKRELLEQYKAALRDRRFLNRNAEALDECLLFRYAASGEIEHGSEMRTDDPSRGRVNHADRVIADALAWKLVQGMELPRRRKAKEEVPVMSMLWRRQYTERLKKEAEAWI